MSLLEAVGTSEATLRYRLLGPLEATDAAGRPVDVGGPKQATVLAVLLLEANRVVPADRLIELVWRDDPPSSATGTLQAYVSHLRRVFEPDRRPRTPSTVIVTRSAGYVAVVERSAIDVSRFEDLVADGRGLAATDPAAARERLSAAIDLWRGPALSDFAGEPFAVGAATRLEGLRLTAEEDLFELMVASGDHRSALPRLEALVAEHPLRERSCALLVRALYHAGRQADALAAYARLRSALRDELGLDPSPELRALEQAVLTHDVPPIGPRTPDRRPPAQTAPPRLPPAGIVGRRSELARFDTALAAVGASGSLLLVEGEPGIGKSRLLQEMTARAAAAGAVVATGRCVEGGAAPAYWPWIQVVAGLAAARGVDDLVAMAGPWGRMLRTLLPEFTPDAADPPPNPLLIGEALATMLDALSRSQPVVILLDDLYGADPDSLGVLGSVTDRLPGLAVVAVGSYRTADVPADHPLTDLLARVTRSEWVARLPLARLQPDAVGRLVEEITGERIDERTAQAIHRQTGGNALFTVELARLLRAEGGLHDPTALGVPPGVRDVIRRRLARLDGRARTLLTAAAVAGRDFDVGLVATAVGLDAESSLDAIEAALSAQLVEETDDPGRFRFSHVLVQAALADQSSALRRAHLHDLFARGLEHRHGDDPAHWAAIAHHAHEAVPATGAAAAVAPMRRAADHAAAVGAASLSAQLLARTVDLIGSLPPGPDRDRLELEVQVRNCWALTMQGFQNAPLDRAAARVIELARSTGSADAVLDGLMSRMGHAFVTGRFADAAAFAVDIGTHAEQEDSDLGRACHHLGAGIATFYQGHLDASGGHFGSCLDLLEILDPGTTGRVMLPPGQQSLASVVLGFSAKTAWMLGRRDQAHDAIARGLAVAAGDTSGFSSSFARMLHVTLGYMDADPARVRAAATAALAEPNAPGFPENTDLIRSFDAWARARLGDGSLDDVRSLCDATATASPVEAVHLWAAVADAGVHLGDAEAALEAVDRSVEVANHTGARSWLPEAIRLRAAAYDLLDERSRADAALAEAAALAAEMGVVALGARIDAWARARAAADA